MSRLWFENVGVPGGDEGVVRVTGDKENVSSDKEWFWSFPDEIKLFE